MHYEGSSDQRIRGLISLLVLFGKGKSCQAGFGQRQQCDMNIEKITISKRATMLPAKLEGRRNLAFSRNALNHLIRIGGLVDFPYTDLC